MNHSTISTIAFAFSMSLFLGCTSMPSESTLADFGSRSVRIESLSGGDPFNIITWTRLFAGDIRAPVVLNIDQSDWARIKGPPEVDWPFPRTYSDEYYARIRVTIDGQHHEIVEMISLSNDTAVIAKRAALERLAMKVRRKVYEIACGAGVVEQH